MIGTTPEISTSFSPTVRNIVIPQTNCFSERKPVHDWQYFGKRISSYYQPEPDTDSLYYPQQPAKYNQRQQYCQDRRTQQACSKNDYDREKWESMSIFVVESLHLTNIYIHY